MKKFIMLLFIFMTTLGRAAINPYTPNSQQWHNHNAAMWAEQDRIKAEREREAMLEQQKIQQQNNQKSLEEEYTALKEKYGSDNPLPSEDVYSMIIIDENSGNVSWNLRFFETKGENADKNALYNMKSWFYKDYNITSEQLDKLSLKHYYFTLGETYAVARGQDKISKKWVLWVMRKTIPETSPKELEEELLEWCYKEGNNCEVILNTTISKRIVK